MSLANRQALAQQFAAWGFSTGAEIGVGDGCYARVLLAANPILHLYAVDPWDAAGGNRRGEASYQRALALLEPMRDRLTVVRETSVDGAAAVPNDLDFVFIDAAHDYESVKTDLETWTPKVRSGGIVSGHDYYTVKNGPMPSGVVRAVDEFVAARGVELQTTPWDRQNPDRDSRQPCFWFRI